MDLVAGPPALRVLLFGHVRVFADGEPFRLGTPRKTLPVLAYLLLHRGAAVARSFLSFLIWPDESEDDARAKLRATLHDLVRVLPPAPDGHWIVSEGTSIRWNPEARCTVDVEDFESGIADPERLEQAIELYSGDLLEALYDEWLVAPRERLRSAYLGALEKVISQSRRRLDYPKAILYARRLLEADPLREDVARRLITLRYDAGDRAGALEEYEKFERRVREELDIEPMPETVALREAIVRNDAIASGAEAADASKPSSPQRTALPFVGRGVELEQLLDAWSRAARGRGGVVFVGGEAGIGKSRLVTEFARDVEERGGRVAVGATGSPETMPYQALVEALRSVLPLVAAIKLDGIWLAVLGTLLPELSARFDEIPALPHIEPENERARLFGALTRAFVALAHPRPLLLVLEDLHWADEATVAALEFLARRIALSPILIVATYRDNETVGRHPLRRARVDATVDGTARSLVLRPLSLDDVERLTHQLTTVSPRSASALLVASEGSPLLIGQLLEEVADVLGDRPTRIADVIRTRLERLSPDARGVAEIAALFGQRFSREAVREVGGWDEPAFTDALDELLDRRLVREATGRGALDYAFVHQTICDVVAGSASPERSADRHRRIARTLEALYPERHAEFAAELARHYAAAGDADAAAAHFLSAARRALSLAALEEAGTYIDRGLTFANAPALRTDLLVERAQLSKRKGDHAALAAAVDQLGALAESTGDDESRRMTALLAVQLAAVTEEKAAHIEALGRLHALARDAGAKWRAAYFLEEAREAYGRTDLERLKLSATSALDAARETGDDASAARAFTWLADVEVSRGNLAAARDCLDQGQAAAARARDGAVELDSLRASFMLAYSEADVDRGLEIAERWLERATALGDRHAEASGRLRLAIALTSARRDMPRVRDELARAQLIYEELRSRRGLAAVLLNRGILANEIGNFADGVAVTERALEIFVTLDDERGKATALGNLATLNVALGNGRRALALAKESRKVARAADLRIAEGLALENLAIATAALGKTAEAIRLGDEALAFNRELDVKAWSGRLMADLALWQAESGDLAGARKRVEEMLVSGVNFSAECPQRFHWAAARVLHACGERERARVELARARELVAETAAYLSGDDLRHFESVSWNRAIIAAQDRDEWPTFSAVLAR